MVYLTNMIDLDTFVCYVYSFPGHMTLFLTLFMYSLDFVFFKFGIEIFGKLPALLLIFRILLSVRF